MGLRWCGNYLERVQLKVPSFPLKCIVPTLNASGRKKKRNFHIHISSPLFFLLYQFLCNNPSCPRIEKGITKSSVITVFYIAKRAFVFTIKNSEERMCKFS